MSDEPDKAEVPGEQEPIDLPIASAYLFARQLQWRLELYLDDKWVVIQLVHTSHKKGGGMLGNTLQPPMEQFTEPQPSSHTFLRRSYFTDEAQIRKWFTSVCEAFDAHLHSILTFEILHHFSDLTRFQLDVDNILAADKNDIINDHIEGRADDPHSIGTRQFLRILLGARGPSNESPANEFNLPPLINEALRNLFPSRLLTYQGVNDYLKKKHHAYAFADGDSLRKRCKACGIDFVNMVREEKARRKAEN
jgi:hypothetical protein